MAKQFQTKDSGIREEYGGGMRRDLQKGKPRFDLIDREYLKDWATLMEQGAVKYGEDNWRLANSVEELNRFKASAFRHFIAWMNGEVDEGHHVAVAFNIAAAEYLMNKLNVNIDGKEIKQNS